MTTEKERTSIEVLPGARRLINSLRNMSYDFVKAVADLIDNSVQANARVVSVRMEFDGDRSWVRISDDGDGMSAEELTEAMRYGSERDYGPNELGRFGLGMKTASFSQCRKLTVASRKNGDDESINIRQWNLDQIDETNRWQVDDIPKEAYSEILTEPLFGSSGTVVLWEHLDRLLKFKPPDGDRARTWFNRTKRELDEHLGMVFHRFIAGDIHGKTKLKITINDSEVIPWDPFAKSERETTILPEKELNISSDGRFIRVKYSPFILPTQARFSSPSAFKRSAGPAKWNSQQGFYIYRENRMIQGGGWCRLKALEEHSKYARAALDFDSTADTVLMLDVTKSTVQLPPELRDELKPLIASLVGESESRYRASKREDHSIVQFKQTGVHKSAQEDVQRANNIRKDTTASEPVNAGSSSKVNLPPKSIDVAAKYRTLGIVIESAARRAGEMMALNRIKAVLNSEEPDAARDLGWC